MIKLKSFEETNLSLLSAPEIADKTRSFAMLRRDEFDVQGDMRAVNERRPDIEQEKM